MLKKIISLILAGVLLLQVSCFYAAAESSSINENTEKMSSTFKDRESDYCSDYGRNNCSKTVDVSCAKRRMYKDLGGKIYYSWKRCAPFRTYRL